MRLVYKEKLRASGLFNLDKRRQRCSGSSVSAGLEVELGPEASRDPSKPSVPNRDGSFHMQFVKRFSKLHSERSES